MIESKLKPTIATVDSCFDFVRSHQYGIASYEVFSWSTDIHILTKMVMTSDETQIQILAKWPMSHAKRVTRDNWKNPEYHVIAALRNLRTDTNYPAGKPWPNHVKNEQHIGSGLAMVFLRGSLCLSADFWTPQWHDILDFSNCPLSRVLHVTLASWQGFGFEFHLRSSPS